MHSAPEKGLPDQPLNYSLACNSLARYLAAPQLTSCVPVMLTKNVSEDW